MIEYYYHESYPILAPVILAAKGIVASTPGSATIPKGAWQAPTRILALELRLDQRLDREA